MNNTLPLFDHIKVISTHANPNKVPVMGLSNQQLIDSLDLTWSVASLIDVVDPVFSIELFNADNLVASLPFDADKSVIDVLNETLHPDNQDYTNT